jgi:hypothetical protein
VRQESRNELTRALQEQYCLSDRVGEGKDSRHVLRGHQIPPHVCDRTAEARIGEGRTQAEPAAAAREKPKLKARVVAVYV